MTTWVAADLVADDVVDLRDDRALAVGAVGSKAANLRAVRRAGLPVIDGFVLPVATAAAIEVGGPVPASVLEAYRGLADGGRVPVVVRSSSPHEDTELSSKAGLFTSVVDVRGVEAFADAVRLVAASGDGAPMAVLVQLHLDPVVSGVAFGVDPVTGATDRVVVAAVAGGPQRLVAGEVAGDRYELGAHGRVRAFEPGDGDTALPAPVRRQLASLLRAAAELRGGPQDVEWAATDEGRVVLLQTRPVTTRPSPPAGPRYGPGPVAETFPAPLARLEADLWLEPLRAALREVAVLTGRVPRRLVDRRPVVVAPGGWAALDLELLDGGRRPGLVGALDPRPQFRRLAASWRVGRLSAALPAIATDLLAACDAALAAIPALDELDDAELLEVLDRAHGALVSLHGHEILTGALVAGDGPTGAEVALHALREAQRAGSSYDDVVAGAPEVLALVAPRIGGRDSLPQDVPALRRVPVLALGPREALRLRIRWVHELTARVGDELGRRLVGRGLLDDAASVRHLDRAMLRAAVGGTAPVVEPLPTGPPLPAQFQLSVDGTVVAVSVDGTGDGVGAGGGRGLGPVHLGEDPPRGAVLVVPVLDPRLAVWLPSLAGLVAETGSPLSHLAILAREHGVPTVVALPGATTRFAPGDEVLVDGATGEVRAIGPRVVEP